MFRSLLFAILICSVASPAAAGRPWIITSSPGSGWPENCPVSLAVAVMSGADTVRIPVALSQDDHVVVIADAQLDSFTDARTRFPDLAGNHDAISTCDLDLESLRQIDIEPTAGTGFASLPCPLATLPEIIAMILQLEHQEQRSISLVIELRKPWLHTSKGKDLAKTVLAVLASVPNDGAESPRSIHLASYDADESARIYRDLLPQSQQPIGIIQLLDANDGKETMHQDRGRWLPNNYDWLFTGFGLRSISAYTDAIGLPRRILTEMNRQDLTAYADNIRSLGMTVIAYPLDPLLEEPEPFATDASTALDELINSLYIDGLMTGRFITLRQTLSPPPVPPVNSERRPVDRLIEHLERRDLGNSQPTTPIMLQ